MSEQLPQGVTLFLTHYPDESWRQPEWLAYEQIAEGAWWLARGFFVQTADSAPLYESFPLFLEFNRRLVSVDQALSLAAGYQSQGGEVIETKYGFQAKPFDQSVVVSWLVTLKL